VSWRSALFLEEDRRQKTEVRRQKEEGRRKKEEGRKRDRSNHQLPGVVDTAPTQLAMSSSTWGGILPGFSYSAGIDTPSPSRNK
jgi:hypothetical protein